MLLQAVFDTGKIVWKGTQHFYKGNIKYHKQLFILSKFRELLQNEKTILFFQVLWLF